ncbi:phosphogluconate dehydrogenase (NADP(+)-dependent, decarboxylating) [Corynebacterium sp. HMSC062E11]|uniref:6-phosphogluconate dehydrogenase, decarboxylating n=1 Tax=Corynebacterium intestinale TaxID=2943492 RepID=A0ABT0T7I0_9CORY|nr:MULTISPECIES: NADP-dependent phosphogluconate dehydrogenase [Corynebacterium]MDK6807274.1 NADP-dependent phosphogluconate dehydrogenase [Corynebacterium aurimucosum]MCL8493052.1 NADP-dependent phosphogluconate dehydrogenase [Corynebacterium intestinale]MCP1389284.1 NADP-dependent phosphogluconate dehydrogenase [Corynebacterium intestinale]NJJ83559.1 NADP-dependent phosphogluconate dehydrogenase [Corynebacterium aurimucosum]OFK25855.1 phosphogluconate dehydrogenase (NADP(+)-dependent, decarb
MTQSAEKTDLAQIGVVGLAVMGSNLARNFARNGNTVAVYNRSPEKTRALISEHGDEGAFIASENVEDFVASLERPRKAIIMVKAGAATDAVIEQLTEAMDEGDIIIDGGNALFTDTIRREKEVAAKGRHFVGAGISGGEEGALNGPSIMPGGPAESWETLGPILESIAANVDGTPCVTHIGPDGAGHFVKMVHNGIEYADMQVIGEAYQLLRYGAGMEPAEIAEVFREWNAGDLDSYLIEITAEVLAQKDPETGAPLVDVIVDAAGQKGTGRWTAINGLELGVPITGIAESVFARALSSATAQRAAAQEGQLPSGTIAELNVDKAEFVEDVRRALYAAKLIAYSQGFDEIKAGSEEFGWNVDPRDLATIWRGGCIIRAKFLDRIREAYDNNADLPALILDPYFKGELENLIDPWRRVVVTATQLGLPVPVFASSLSYYDSLRAERLPAALIQGQRDFFGAHTFKRVDREGTFHIEWSGDRSLTEM